MAALSASARARARMQATLCGAAFAAPASPRGASLPRGGRTWRSRAGGRPLLPAPRPPRERPRRGVQQQGIGRAMAGGRGGSAQGTGRRWGRA
eukprot:scaffold115_cov304-Prasinococcus_capsulatus_cf.AAC.34